MEDLICKMTTAADEDCERGERAAQRMHARAIGLGATVNPALLILPFMSTGSKEPPCDVAVAVAEGRAPPRVKKKQGVADAVKSLLPKLKDGEAQRGKVPDLKKLVPKSPKKLLDKLKLFGKD